MRKKQIILNKKVKLVYKRILINNLNVYENKMKCSFCKDNLLYIDKVECNTGQQMILYKCNGCNIEYKKFTLCRNEIII